MAKRLLLFVASATAAAALAAALSLAGFGPRPGVAREVATTGPAMAADVVPAPVLQIDPVYVPAPAPAKTITIHRTVPATGGGQHESEHETGGDD